MQHLESLTNIGRFAIKRVLGTGSQSAVYLAFDPHLEREVAIKTLQLTQQRDALNTTESLLQEARTVSKLRHPNIIPIFEADMHKEDPYLVFEYVEGQTLTQKLAEQRRFPANKAVELIIQVLDAISHAHAHQIIHRDLKPSNILITADGVPRVMDFGIAVQMKSDSPMTSDLVGTPTYMAPEYISSKLVSVKTDIFAAGLILYELVTGKRAITGNSFSQIKEAVLNAPIYQPSDKNEYIDEKLGDVILKALNKNPMDRYESALEMKTALTAYLQPTQNTTERSEESKQGTLEFLLRRMRHKSDFPALSESVSAINKIISSEQESINKLSNTVLKDFALTNKLLKIANSAFYGSVGGGTISTISRAVVILGFDSVRNIAITLLLFEHLQNRGQASQLKDQFVKALFSGVVSKAVASKAMMRDVEESFICAMFHNLGRLLAIYYFPEETEAINKLMLQKDCSEDIASEQLLGLSYQDLGLGVAKIWGFPEQIVTSMRKLPEGNVKKPRTNGDKLRAISGLSNELCVLISTTPADKQQSGISELCKRFQDAIPLHEKQINGVVEQAFKEAAEYARILKLNLEDTLFGNMIAQKAGGKEKVPEKLRTVGPTEMQATSVTEEEILNDTQIVATEVVPDIRQDAAESAVESGKEAAQSILTAGIQDISNSLVEERALNDVLRMILETMFRAIGFSRVLLCIKDGRQNSMNGRFGFGADVNQLAKDFKFSLSYTPDVFHAAISKGVDILISDINDPKIATRVPDWYKKLVTAKTFLLFPLNIKGSPVALIYADKEHAGDIVIPEKELNLLRTLRNQALLAIKQSL